MIGNSQQPGLLAVSVLKSLGKSESDESVQVFRLGLLVQSLDLDIDWEQILCGDSVLIITEGLIMPHHLSLSQL